MHKDKALVRLSPLLDRLQAVQSINGVKENGIVLAKGRSLDAGRPAVGYGALPKNFSPFSKQEVRLLPKFCVVQDLLDGLSCTICLFVGRRAARLDRRFLVTSWSVYIQRLLSTK
jgi:hypothetical protein